jgi:hypothetical protein
VKRQFPSDIFLPLIPMVIESNSDSGIDPIHKAIAQAGHDTEREKTPDEVYVKLPGCCKNEGSK